jgi:hypothetical protein
MSSIAQDFYDRAVDSDSAKNTPRSSRGNSLPKGEYMTKPPKSKSTWVACTCAHELAPANLSQCSPERCPKDKTGDYVNNIENYLSLLGNIAETLGSPIKINNTSNAGLDMVSRDKISKFRAVKSLKKSMDSDFNISSPYRKKSRDSGSD